MDIQIFTNFALQPEMNIQIFQNFALSPTLGHSSTSKKRAADEAPDFEPPYKKYQRKRNKMSPEKIKEGVEVLVERYQIDEVQKANLESVAQLTHFVPSVEQVEWLVTEARLREDCSYELNYYMLAYMEFFPWFLDDNGGDFRLSIGELNGPGQHLRIGFYLNPGRLHREHRDKGFAKRSSWYRRRFTWLAPFDHLCQMNKMLPEDCSEERYVMLPAHDRWNVKVATDLQTKYFKAIMKVLARFPGLVRELDNPRNSRDTRHHQLHEDWSAQPFRYKEKSSENNPLAELFKKLCAKTGRVRQARLQATWKVIDDQDNDENEDGEGHGDGLGVEAREGLGAEAGDGAGVEADNGTGMSL
jgi:hypothetical protein